MKMQYGTITLRPHWLQWLFAELPSLLLCLAGYVCIGMEDSPTECIRGLMLVMVAGMTLVAAYRLLYWSRLQYVITGERLIVRQGVFSVSKDYLELYRVFDLKERHPFLLRIFGLKKVLIMSYDRTTPQLWICGVDSDLPLVDILRERVQASRKTNGIYEMANR